jgi:hypothetical protein
MKSALKKSPSNQVTMLKGQGKSTYTFSAEHLPLSAYCSPPHLLALRGKQNVTENVYVDLPGPSNAEEHFIY